MFRRILRSKTLQARTRWILAIVMVPPFIFFFHMWVGGSRPTPGPGGSAGILFGRHVPWETFEQEYAWLHRTVEARFGTLPEALVPYLRQQTWDRLILRAEARRRVKVSDEELARDIQNHTTFQKDGRFVADLYFQFVRGTGVSPQAFEERLRDDLRIETLLDSVKAQVRLTDEEVRAAYANVRERVRATVMVIRPSMFAPQVAQALTEADLLEYYTTHQEALRLAPKRTIDYLGMSLREAVDKEGAISEEEISVYYDEHAELFTKADGSSKSIEDVRGTIQQDLKAQKARTRLTDLALDLEDDVESGLRFAEIALTRGLLVHTGGPIELPAPAISNGPTSAMLSAAFDVPLGRMTPVFNTPSGAFLLIPVEEFPSRIPPFEEVRDQVRQLLMQERSREAAKARAGELRDQLLVTRKEGVPVEETSLLLSVKPLHPAPFTRQGPIEGLEGAATVAEALLTVKPGELSEVLEAPQGFVIGFVEERVPFDEPQFAKEKDSFRQAVLESRQQEQITRWLDALRTKARLKSFLE